jgi:hypothetical protein
MPPPIRGLGNVRPHVKAAAEKIAATFGVYNIGGFATAGHIPGSDHYTGHALDVMTFTDMSKGNLVAEWTKTNWSTLNIKYMIWNRRYWDSPTKSSPYTGSSPHTDHVHISFNTSGGSGDIQNVAGGSGGESNDGCLTVLKQLAGM